MVCPVCEKLVSEKRKLSFVINCSVMKLEQIEWHDEKLTEQ